MKKKRKNRQTLLIQEFQFNQRGVSWNRLHPHRPATLKRISGREWRNGWTSYTYIFLIYKTGFCCCCCSPGVTMRTNGTRSTRTSSASPVPNTRRPAPTTVGQAECVPQWGCRIRSHFLPFCPNLWNCSCFIDLPESLYELLRITCTLSLHILPTKLTFNHSVGRCGNMRHKMYKAWHPNPCMSALIKTKRAVYFRKQWHHHCSNSSYKQ